MVSLNPSLERIYPDDPQSAELEGAEVIRFHLERYQFAKEHLRPGLIADIACGSGYGSQLLASTGSTIIAVDSDRDAVEYANLHYPHPSITFLCADAMDFFWGTQFQSVVSLETIEHLRDPAGFVKHMSRELAPGGRFIASAPVTPSMDANPYHLNDFTDKSFRKLFLDCGLKEITSKLQVQPYKPFQLMKKQGLRRVRKNLLAYYLRHPSKAFLRMRSVIVDGFKNKYLLVVFEKPF